MWIKERVNKAGNVVPAFQIDECFAEEVCKYSWLLLDGRYLIRGYRVKQVRHIERLHHFIWRIASRQPVSCLDHINGDRFDNRLENLRQATARLNAKNVRRRKQTKHNRLPGVNVKYYSSCLPRYLSGIKHRSHSHHLGTYDTAKEASAVYQNAKEILIEFANLPGYENVLTGGSVK